MSFASDTVDEYLSEMTKYGRGPESAPHVLFLVLLRFEERVRASERARATAEARARFAAALLKPSRHNF
jgi:hypothetical protein